MPFLRVHDSSLSRTPRDTRSRRVALGAARRAFSLIELVVVILIVAIFTAIAAPRFTESAARSRVTAAADRLGAEIMLTRERARAASAPRVLRVARGSGDLALLDADGKILSTTTIGLEPYLATVVRTDLPASKVAFTAYALPLSSGRIMLRSAGQLAIVSIASDGTVSVSAATPSRAPDPALADVVTQLGDGLIVREITATPGNTIVTSVAEVKAK
jgi:prepilin-type N-terminal cleavage/methylation domain-containing protein